MEIKAGNAAQSKGSTKSVRSVHPDTNRIVFYPNTTNYASYDEERKGGVINSLYSVMMNKENNDKNFLEIQDLMKQQTNHRNIKVKDDDGGIGEYSVIIETKTVMQYSEMMRMYFKKNKTKKDVKIIKMKNTINYKHNVLFM